MAAKLRSIIRRNRGNEDVTIPPNDRTVTTIQSQIYAENAVTGILQPSALLHEEGDVTFCAATVTLNEGTMGIRVNNFTDQPYTLTKGLHIANFSVTKRKLKGRCSLYQQPS